MTQVAVVVEVLNSRADATTRCMTRVSTSGSTNSGVRASVKQAANRSVSAIEIKTTDGPLGLAQQQGAGVRGDRAATEAGHHAAALDG
jgi:hypothetical protein